MLNFYLAGYYIHICAFKFWWFFSIFYQICND